MLAGITRVSFFSILLVLTSSLYAQTYNMGNLGTVSTCTGTFYDSGGPSGNYGVNNNFTATFCSNSGQPIWFQFSQFDMGLLGAGSLSIYDGPNTGSPLIGTYTGTNSPGTITSNNASNCLTFTFQGGGGFFAGSGWVASINCGSAPPPPSGTQCSAAQPFCSGTSYNFPAATNTTAESGPDYGCLLTQPNPVWYYMQIDNPGNLDLTLSNTNNVDVDFICWGPFNSLNGICSQLTSANEVDCSYSIDPTEYINIAGAQTGQYYMLCITNYSNQATNFILTTDGTSTASTNCLILCNITGMSATPGACNPIDNLHTVTGTLAVSFPPTTGTLTITTSTGQTITYNAPFSGVVNYSIPGVNSSGGTISVTAQFSTDTSCHFTTPYQSPVPCTCTAVAGNNSPVCAGANVNLTANTIAGATYQWSGPNAYSSTQQNPVINSATPSASGIYSVTVTSSGCTATDTTLVEVGSNPVIGNPTITQASCLSGGSITISASGGTGTLTYAWSNGQTGTTISNLAAGPYDVTVSDQNSCSATATYNVTSAPNVITLTSPTIVDIACNGDNNGSITANASGGTGTITYTWSNGQTGATISNLTPGTYSVTATDINTCSTSASYVVTEPTAIAFGTATIDTTTCNAGGSISVSASGGTGTITFAWSNGGSGATITNVPAGSYTVTASDQNLCTITATYTVQAGGGSLTISNPIVTNVTCFGGNDGSISITATGGNGAIVYAWSNSQTGSSISNLAAGNYSVTVSDATGCSGTGSYDITQPAALTINHLGETPVSCHGGSDGTQTISVSGGSTPYSYLWGNGQTTTTANGLPAGTVGVTVTDANACTAAQSYIVTEPSPMLVSVTATDALCFGASNGAVTVNPSGGNQPYTFLWSNGQVVPTLSAVPSGNYLVTVTDATNCTASGSTTVSEPADLIVYANGHQVKCIGDANGMISVAATGGTPPYNFSATKDFANFVFTTDDTIRGLRVGTYTVVVADDNGCTKTTPATVPDATPDYFTYTTDSTSCFGTGYLDGAVHVISTSLQNSPYQYGVDGGALQFSGDFFGLGAGNHDVTAVNHNGCASQLTVFVPEPLPIVVNVTPDTLWLDLGETGAVQVTYLNASNVTYAWTPFSGFSCTDCANPQVTVYQSGDYQIMVSTENGTSTCFATATLRVEVGRAGKPFIPSAFSPNGDGNNDVFEIYGAGIKTVDLKVFNRWGEMVYRSNNQFAGWDGTYKGELQMPGVFTYTTVVTFLDNKTFEKTGSITLVR